MSIMVVVRFPVPRQQLLDWAKDNLELLLPIRALFEKHGRISHLVVTSENEFLDLDEWPSREAYAAFKAEAGAMIEVFESTFGHRSTDAIYDVVKG